MRKVILLFVASTLLLSGPSIAQKSDGLVLFDTPDSFEAQAYFIESQESGGEQWLVLIPDYRGVTDEFLKVIHEWQKIFPDFNIVAPDLYDGREISASTSDRKLEGVVDRERVLQIIHGLRLQVGPRSTVSFVSWGDGGDWAIEAASILRKQVRSIVSYHHLPLYRSTFKDKISAELLCVIPQDGEQKEDRAEHEFLEDLKSCEGQVEIVYFNENSFVEGSGYLKFRRNAQRKAWKIGEDFIRSAHYRTY